MNFVFDIDGTTSFNGMVIEPAITGQSRNVPAGLGREGNAARGDGRAGRSCGAATDL